MSLVGKHIWICPLNWGLGHASRCIPIIRALQTQGATIYLASDGDAARLLEKEFPELPLFELPGYSVQYGRRSAVGGLIWRIPAIFKAIHQEQKALAKLIEGHACDLIISDNRYGAWSASHPSVLISHQLHLALPSFVQKFSNQVLKYWFAKFQEIWVPDWPLQTSLAGKLSQGEFSKPVRHLGILSRMQLLQTDNSLDVLAVLSGPEPQRTQLEEKILAQLSNWPGPRCLVRGTKALPPLQSVPEGLQIIELANTEQLEKLMASAEMIICRTGYSSLMDLVQMEKSALVIPTPGQPEQEYLANYHTNKNWWKVQTQAELDVAAAWEDRNTLAPPRQQKMNIDNWLAACRAIINC